MAAVGLRAGDSVAGYTIERLLGAGGMGAVYLATQPRLERRVALKVLPPGLADDESFRERFIRESQLAASLEHPNIVPIYDADDRDGVLFIAMRYVEGSDLKQRLQAAGQLSLEQTLEVVGEVAKALDAAHRAGLVHRDVKPANILVQASDGHVFLSDFGLAKRTSSAGLTRTGSFLGTVDYCPPEQIRGEPLDHRADVYSLACVAFHCLAGQPPFPKETDVAVIQAHLTDPVPALSTARPGLPLALDGVLATGMAKYPEVRYDSASELAAALAGAADATGLKTKAADPRPAPAPMPPTVVGRPVHTRASSTEALPPKRRVKGWHWAAGAAALLLLVGAAVAGVGLVGGSGEGTSGTLPTTTPTPRVTTAARVTLTDQVAGRMASIAPAQRAVAARLDDVSSATTSLVPLQTAGENLQRQVLRAQGFRQRLTAGNQLERAELDAFDDALDRQAAYARQLVNLPSSAADLRRAQAQELVDTAAESEDAYTRLSGITSGLPQMPVTRRQALPLLDAVHTAARPQVRTTVVTTTSEPVEPEPPAVTDFNTYSGSMFTLGYPSSWYVDTSEALKSTYVDTTIRDPSDRLTYIRADYSPGANVSVEEAAAGQRANHSRLDGYSELSYTSTTLGGYPAIRWEFVEPQDGVMMHKVDTFFVDENGTGWAVLVQAPVERFGSLNETFSRVYETFQRR